MASRLRIRMLLHKIRARFDIVIDEQQHIAQRSRHRRILRSRDAHPFQPKVPHLNRRSIWQHDCVDRLAAVGARAIQRNDHFKRTAVIQLLFAQVRQQPPQRFRTTTGRYNDADMWSQNRLPRPDLSNKDLYQQYASADRPIGVQRIFIRQLGRNPDRLDPQCNFCR